MSRPSTKVTSFRVSDETRQLVAELATKLNTTRTAVIEQAVQMMAAEHLESKVKTLAAERVTNKNGVLA